MTNYIKQTYIYTYKQIRHEYRPADFCIACTLIQTEICYDNQVIAEV